MSLARRCIVTLIVVGGLALPAHAGDADQEKQWDESTDAANDAYNTDNPVTKFIKKYVPTGDEDGTMDKRQEKDLEENVDMPAE